MNKLFILMLALLLLISLPVTGCQSLVKGSGNLETKDYDFTDFLRVEIDGPFEVNIAYADSYQVSVTADDNMLEKIEISNEDNTLKIGLQSARYSGLLRIQYVDASAQVTISMPRLRSLFLSGMAKGTCSDFDSRASADFNIAGASSLDIQGISVGDVNFNVTSASKVTGEIIAGDAEFNEAGASSIQLIGSANIIVCGAKDTSQLELDDFIVDIADVRLRGASIGTVNVNGKLHADLSEGSILSYLGEPIMGNIKISGGSAMNRKSPVTSTPTSTSAAPTPSFNWPLIGGIIGGVVVVGLIIFFLVRRRD